MDQHPRFHFWGKRPVIGPPKRGRCEDRPGGRVQKSGGPLLPQISKVKPDVPRRKDPVALVTESGNSSLDFPVSSHNEDCDDRVPRVYDGTVLLSYASSRREPGDENVRNLGYSQNWVYRRLATIAVNSGPIIPTRKREFLRVSQMSQTQGFLFLRRELDQFRARAPHATSPCLL